MIFVNSRSLSSLMHRGGSHDTEPDPRGPNRTTHPKKKRELSTVSPKVGTRKSCCLTEDRAALTRTNVIKRITNAEEWSKDGLRGTRRCSLRIRQLFQELWLLHFTQPLFWFRLASSYSCYNISGCVFYCFSTTLPRSRTTNNLLTDDPQHYIALPLSTFNDVSLYFHSIPPDFPDCRVGIDRLLHVRCCTDAIPAR